MTGMVSLYLRSRIATTLAGLAGFVAIIAGVSVASNLDLDIFPSPEDAPTISLSATFNDVDTIDEAEAAVAEVEDSIKAVVGDDLDRVMFFDVDLLGASIQLDLVDGHSRPASEITESLETELATLTVASVAANTGSPPTVAFAATEDDLAALEAAVPAFLAAHPDADFAAVAPTAEVVSRWNDDPVIVAELVFADDADEQLFLDELGQAAEDGALVAGFTADRVTTTDPISEDQEESFGAMGVVFVFSVFAIALLLVVQFRSILLPGLILMAIPLSLPLLFPGLYGVGAEISFFVMLGISALIGIAVNNSILLIDYANQEVRTGADPVTAIIDALRIRFRPLVTATLTTVVGVYPLTTDPRFSGLAWDRDLRPDLVDHSRRDRVPRLLRDGADPSFGPAVVARATTGYSAAGVTPRRLR